MRSSLRPEGPAWIEREYSREWMEGREGVYRERRGARTDVGSKGREK
jgi:hypothetical protein